MSDSPDQRLLLVHAHPDDETIGSGATMAKYVAEGRGVTLVTCTGGEMGEILVPELEHLAADRDDGLAEHRRGELDEAMRILGVTDHRFLGGFGRYRDSGMVWHEDGHAVPADDIRDNAFWNADLTEAADAPGGADPRGAAPGARHLRPVRDVRPPRPHPGPPGRDVRRAAGRGAVVPARPRRAVGDRQDLLDRDVGEPDARPRPGAAGGGRHHVVRWPGPRRAAADDHPGRRHHCRRGGRSTSSTGSSTRCGPIARRSRWTARSSPSPTTSVNRAWGTEYYRIARGRPVAPDAGGLEDDLFAGL